MLALDQIRDTPAIKRALPAFEIVLSKNKLYPMSTSDTEQINTMQTMSQDQAISDGHILQPPQTDMTLPQDDQSFLYGDFIGFDFLDRWQMEQLDFTGIY